MLYNFQTACARIFKSFFFFVFLSITTYEFLVLDPAAGSSKAAIPEVWSATSSQGIRGYISIMDNWKLLFLSNWMMLCYK